MLKAYPLQSSRDFEKALFVMDCVLWSLCHSILVHCYVVAWIGVNFRKRVEQSLVLQSVGTAKSILPHIRLTLVKELLQVPCKGKGQAKDCLEFSLRNKWY